jgi:UDP-N-acetylmuramyl pentapeptide synthase
LVSVDHFRQELLAQMSRAATQGRIDILVTSGEFCRSIRRSDLQMSTCCDASQEEIKAGDVLLVERTNGAGLIVCYLLPRAEFTFGIAVP